MSVLRTWVKWLTIAAGHLRFPSSLLQNAKPKNPNILPWDFEWRVKYAVYNVLRCCTGTNYVKLTTAADRSGWNRRWNIYVPPVDSSHIDTRMSPNESIVEKLFSANREGGQRPLLRALLSNSPGAVIVNDWAIPHSTMPAAVQYQWTKWYGNFWTIIITTYKQYGRNKIQINPTNYLCTYVRFELLCGTVPPILVRYCT